MTDVANLAAIGDWLAETYSPIMEKHFDTGSLVLDMWEKGDMSSPKLVGLMPEKVGRRVVLGAHTGGLKNANIPVSEGHSYPRAGAQSRARLQYEVKRHVTTMQETAEAIARSEGDQNFVENIAAHE